MIREADRPVGRHQVALARVRDHLLDVMGTTVRDLLTAPDVTDVILNPDGRLWVSRLGHERQAVGFMPADQAMRFIGAVAASMNTEATEDTPSVQGHLITDGSRFQGCIPPIVEAPFFAIRRRASAVFPLARYVAHGQMTERQKAIIEAAIADRRNILVVGGTGAGKSTLINGLLHSLVEIHPHHRIFGIEDTVELQCAALDQTFARTSATMDIRALVRIAMRSFADRIIIGEARGPEMLDILMAWGTGHPGGFATIHSDIARPEAGLERVEDLLLQATNNPVPRMIARTVNVIICIDRSQGARRVSQVVTVHGHDGQDYQLHSET
jgi:P-type conjugative transfer ATPase TrbB